MYSTLRTVITAAVSSLLTMSLVAGCEVVRPFVGLTPVPAPTAPQAPAAASPSTGVPAAPASPAAPPVAAPSLGSVQARPALAQALSGAGDVIPKVYQAVSASVVNVVSIQVSPDFFNQPTPQARGSGSGFFIDDSGNILTNNHVVEDAQRLEVTLADGTTMPAQLRGRDPRADLAVIKVDLPKEKIRVAPLGDDSQLQVGELAIAIGNPFGLEQTVTAGIISARRRVVDEPGGGLLVQAVQTDASINPGNSGGPLLNGRGEVIGVNTLIVSPSSGIGGQGGNVGIGFAQSIGYAKRIFPALIKDGKFPHPYIGVGTVAITATMQTELKLPVKEGLLVGTVDQGSGAQRAGIRPGTQQAQSRTRSITTGGDILTAIDGQPLKTPQDLVVYLETSKAPGDTVTLTALRDGQTMQFPITLGERPQR
ncbi:MAG: trypsin-like peptidase domain-containing protein [Chloroflexi bacterium]|nr:trypsin-like peptidase domain-containing protein [Chloroflexota bacterium]